jgi:hypothetical protein
MHNIFLGLLLLCLKLQNLLWAVGIGLICHFFMEVIFKLYMLSGAGGANSAKQRFENIVNAIRWPSHITRLPKNVCDFDVHDLFTHLSFSLVKISPSKRPTSGDVYSQ